MPVNRTEGKHLFLVCTDCRLSVKPVLNTRSPKRSRENKRRSSRRPSKANLMIRAINMLVERIAWERKLKELVLWKDTKKHHKQSKENNAVWHASKEKEDQLRITWYTHEHAPKREAEIELLRDWKNVAENIITNFINLPWENYNYVSRKKKKPRKNKTCQAKQYDIQKHYLRIIQKNEDKCSNVFCCVHLLVFCQNATARRSLAPPIGIRRAALAAPA